MLFHSLYAPESGMYFEQLHYTIQGNVDVELLRRAWWQVSQRHDILRTAFIWEGIDEPHQVVHLTPVLDWQQFDWRDHTPVEQHARLEALLAADRKRGFDLSTQPLTRYAICHVADDVHMFIWSHHHLLLDGWSQAIVLREVVQIYQGLRDGQPVQLAPAPPYSSYIAWLQQQPLDRAEQFWRTHLRGFQAPTQIGPPASAGLPQAEDYDRRAFTLSAEQTALVDQFARQHGLTRNTLLQAAWALLLSRYSGERAVVFGSTTAGRPADLAHAEAMVGLFINTLPVHVLIEPQARLIDWLTQIQALHAQIRHYEYAPLVQIQGWSEVPRGLPLFESILVFANYPVDPSLIQLDQRFTIRKTHALERTNYPLMLQSGSGLPLSATLVFDRQRFDPGSIERLLEHYQTLLLGMLRDSQQRLADIPLLRPAERQRLLTAWNHTFRPRDPADSLIQRIVAQVECTPDAPALQTRSGLLSYRQLDRRARSLAALLRLHGVGPEARVAVLLPRNADLVAALLGVLYAGGAYIPLDPSYPAARLHAILHDAGPLVVLTTQDLAAGLADLPGVCLAVDQLDLAALPAAEPAAVAPEQLAYLIYTSGSTGQPKGVEIPHRALLNLLEALRERPGLRAEDRLLAVTTVSFDIAVLELWLPLSVGAQITLADDQTIADGEQLLELLRRSGATVLQATPATWQLLIEAGWQGDHQLKALVGGEALPPDLAGWLADACASVWNMYGPTETTVWSACGPVFANERPISVGRPIDNTQMYVLDEWLEPVPVGVAGLLYIGGDGLARGYHNRPDLTAEQFVPNPFGVGGARDLGREASKASGTSSSQSAAPGPRLYRTGDLARYLPDGRLEILGRTDQQVKVRGFRIELGEVEATLRQHPDLREAAVVARDDLPGGRGLAAYVVTHPGAALLAGELRQFLQRDLPNYMVPAAFITLPELPRTPNGKLDRRSLPAPAGTRISAAAYAAPQNDLERTIAAIWQDVLGGAPVGIDDNFFDLGGHSLLMLQVNSRLREALDQPIPMVALFEHPTVRLLAEHLSGPPIQTTDTVQERGERRRELSKQQRQLRQQRRRDP
ncbi:MAG: hypothetical protein OHK0022_50680 [Roseiflexaceae bacterium]